MLNGLIRVLLEEEEGCCEGIDALFSDAVAKDISNFEDIVIYTTSVDLRTESNGVLAKTMWDNAVSLEEKCKILNTLQPIVDVGRLSTKSEQDIEALRLEICPPTPSDENIGGTQTCTDVNKAGSHGKSWYKFDYNGAYSDQVRSDYYYMVLDKLGIGMFAPGQEGKCVENVRIWEKEPDRYSNGVNQGPTIDWWKGFRINCNCIPDNSPYKNNNLNIYDLDHPNIKKTGVPVEKTSSNSKKTKTSVNNDNTNQDDGLVNVINNDVETNPYEDITFL